MQNNLKSDNDPTCLAAYRKTFYQSKGNMKQEMSMCDAPSYAKAKKQEKISF
jgi:hypothetical protein